MGNGTFYAWVSNEQGATEDVRGRFGNQRATEDAARAQFGKGWKVHVMKVGHDGDDGYFPPEEVRTFTLRRRA